MFWEIAGARKIAKLFWAPRTAVDVSCVFCHIFLLWFVSHAGLPGRLRFDVTTGRSAPYWFCTGAYSCCVLHGRASGVKGFSGVKAAWCKMFLVSVKVYCGVGTFWCKRCVVTWYWCETHLLLVYKHYQCCKSNRVFEGQTRTLTEYNLCIFVYQIFENARFVYQKWHSYHTEKVLSQHSGMVRHGHAGASTKPTYQNTEKRWHRRQATLSSNKTTVSLHIGNSFLWLVSTFALKLLPRLAGYYLDMFGSRLLQASPKKIGAGKCVET